MSFGNEFSFFADRFEFEAMGNRFKFTFDSRGFGCNAFKKSFRLHVYFTLQSLGTDFSGQYINI
jgi:hypothetical protein